DFGKGKVLLSIESFNTPELRQLFYDTLDDAVGERPFRCANNLFELVLRENKHRERFLFVLNPHTRDRREDTIVIAGRFAQCTDLGIGSGVPLPVSLTDSETKFKLRLH